MILKPMDIFRRWEIGDPPLVWYRGPVSLPSSLFSSIQHQEEGRVSGSDISIHPPVFFSLSRASSPLSLLGSGGGRGGVVALKSAESTTPIKPTRCSPPSSNPATSRSTSYKMPSSSIPRTAPTLPGRATRHRPLPTMSSFAAWSSCGCRLTGTLAVSR